MLGSLQFLLGMGSSSLPKEGLLASDCGLSCRENVDRGSHATAENSWQSSWDLWEKDQLFFFKSSFKARY